MSSGDGRKVSCEDIQMVHFILRTLIRTFKASFLPFLDELSSYLLPMWAKEKITTERCSSICIFVNLIEECPEAALKYYDSRLPLILDASNDEHLGVRQSALYGLVLWAEYGRSSFKPFVGEALSRINIVIMHLRARELENELAYDNVVSALGKICQFHGESIGSTQVLCSEKNLATEKTRNRMINVLRHLQQTLPPDTMESAWSYTLPWQEMKLKFSLSPEEDANF